MEYFREKPGVTNNRVVQKNDKRMVYYFYPDSEV